MAHLGSQSSSPFSREWISAEQSILSSAVTTIAHTLGVRPKHVLLIARCKTAEYGYAVDDEVTVSAPFYSGVNYGGDFLRWDASNIYILQGVENSFRNTSTGAAVASFTAANWRFEVRAYA